MVNFIHKIDSIKDLEDVKICTSDQIDTVGQAADSSLDGEEWIKLFGIFECYGVQIHLRQVVYDSTFRSILAKALPQRTCEFFFVTGSFVQREWELFDTSCSTIQHFDSIQFQEVNVGGVNKDLQQHATDWSQVYPEMSEPCGDEMQFSRIPYSLSDVEGSEMAGNLMRFSFDPRDHIIDQQYDGVFNNQKSDLSYIDNELETRYNGTKRKHDSRSMWTEAKSTRRDVHENRSGWNF
eukprot:752888-Hanusia_phi.AAC.7